MNQPEFISIYVTVRDIQEAEAIADHLIRSELAACVNIIPGVQSIYQWQGGLCHDREVVMFVKTGMTKYAEAAAAIKSKHSYETPCILALPIQDGYKPYLDWMRSNISNDR